MKLYVVYTLKTNPLIVEFKTMWVAFVASFKSQANSSMRGLISGYFLIHSCFLTSCICTGYFCFDNFVIFSLLLMDKWALLIQDRWESRENSVRGSRTRHDTLRAFLLVPLLFVPHFCIPILSSVGLTGCPGMYSLMYTILHHLLSPGLDPPPPPQRGNIDHSS